MKLLNKYDKTCEVALSAFACDIERMKDLQPCNYNCSCNTP